MKLLKPLLFLTFVFSVCSMSAQKVKFKKGKVLINKAECFKYDGGALSNTVTLYDFKDNEVLSFEWIQGNYSNPTHFDVFFASEEIRVKIKTNTAGRKDFIKRLIKGKVIKDCKLDPEKLKVFIKKNSL